MCKREITVDEAKSLLKMVELLCLMISYPRGSLFLHTVVKGQSIRYEFPPRVDPSAKKFPVVGGRRRVL